MSTSARSEADRTVADPTGRPSRGDRVTLAYDRLRELIVMGRLAPGSRIIETAIASMLGVSRTPIRAALQRLQQEGFVISHSPGHQLRMSVAPLTKADAYELFGMVAVFEGLAAAGAASQPDDVRAAIVPELRDVNERLLAASSGARRDVNLVFVLDRTFHRRIVEAGAGPRMLALHESLKPQSERYGRIYTSVLTDEIATSVREHENVVGAIEAGAPEAAEAAMRRNWMNAASRIAQVIADRGIDAKWRNAIR